MRNSSLLVGIILSVLLFVAGLFIYAPLVKGLANTIDGVAFVQLYTNMMLLKVFVFAMGIGLLPFLITLVWKTAPVISFKKKIFSLFVVLAFIFFAGLLNYAVTLSMAKDEKKTFAERKEKFMPEGAVALISYQRINIELYLPVGLAIGCIISFFKFREEYNIRTLDFDKPEYGARLHT